MNQSIDGLVQRRPVGFNSEKQRQVPPLDFTSGSGPKAERLQLGPKFLHASTTPNPTSLDRVRPLRRILVPFNLLNPVLSPTLCLPLGILPAAAKRESAQARQVQQK